MRFSVSVVDGGTGQRQEVLVDARPEHTVADLLPRLVELTTAGAAPMHPTFAARVAVWVDGRPVERDLTLREAGVQPGSTLALHEPDGTRPGLPRGVAEVRVVSGPGAGRVHRLGLGDTVIGCGAPGLSLPDVLLPADALTVTVGTDGAVRVTAADGVDAQLEREPLTEAHDWPEGTHLACGATVLELRSPWEPDADTSPGEDRLGVDFNRPPRLLPPPRERSFTMPVEPGEPHRQPIPWLMVLAPLLMCVPSLFMFGPRGLVFGLMSPLMALVNVVSGRRGGARSYKERKTAYDAERASVEARLAAALATERSDRRALAPDPAEVLLNALGPGRRLWERRRQDPDYLAWRLGVAERPSQVSVTDRNVKDTDEPAPPVTVNDVPVVMSLRDNGVVGIAGDADVTDALAAWLVCQTAVLQSPRDVRVVVVTNADGGDRWGWARWLPHCRVDDERVPAMIGTDQESVGRRVGELSNLVTERLSAMSGQGGSRTSPAPDVLLVLDGARRLRSLPGVVQLLRDGPSAGVHILCVDDDERSLPEECRAVITSGAGGVDLRQTLAEDVRGIRPDQVETAWAERVARALAPIRDTTPSEDDAGLPSSARLLECVDLEDPTPEAVASRWTGARTDVVIGEGFDGPFRLDLRRDGPHALIAGTTGSGKSELLQTLVASLAIANRPDELTFVLVDYKGGSAFKECARLPHTVGMVTDLDTHLVGRALTSLGAELRRREHLLTVPGAKDIEDYWALRRSDPSLPAMPRLAIIIDEFASLKAELPDFVTGLVTIAQRGRSLGIHLVLATQRPGGVVSADIRANTNLRIALRVTDESESRDVIDAPESARIPQGTPGRGYARLGHSSLLPFQAGRVGGRRPGSVPDHASLAAPLAWPIGWDRVGLPAPVRPVSQGPDTDEGDTDLSVLVEAINGADRLAGVPDQPSPWLPPLPQVVTLADLRERAAAAGEEATGRHTAVPWLLEDRPDDQAQVARTFGLGRDGHLFLVGGPRSGRSTALRTLAGALARDVPARDLHLYALDCGNGALLPLTTLPHTGAVAQRTEVERVSRLLERLTGEVTRRQDVLSREGYADIEEQRAGAAAGERLPHVVLLLDRWEGFLSDLAEIDMGRLLDDMTTLLREGASVGIQVVVAGDRSLLTGRVSSLVEHKLILRLPDRTDYTSAGLRSRDVPDTIGDGRGLWAEVGTEGQVAVLAEDTSGVGQGAALRAIAAEVAERDADVPPPLQPMRLGVLPAEVGADEVLKQLEPGSPLLVPLGIGGDRLEPLRVDLTGSPAALVTGPPRSGRTNALQLVATYAAQQDAGLLAFTPRENALTTLVQQLGHRCFTGTEHDTDAVLEAVRALAPGSLVLVDDAESLREGPVAPVLLAVVRQARERGLGLVLAGQGADLAAGFSGWLYEARKGRQGLLLSPQEPVAGDAFGVRVARTALQARVHPGRGVLLDGSGEQVMVQVPLVS